MYEVIEHLVSPDNQMRITIRRRPDGFFECSLDKFHIDDLPEHDHYMEYWATMHVWGIYDTALTAKRESTVEFPWIVKGNWTDNA